MVIVIVIGWPIRACECLIGRCPFLQILTRCLKSLAYVNRMAKQIVILVEFDLATKASVAIGSCLNYSQLDVAESSIQEAVPFPGL